MDSTVAVVRSAGISGDRVYFEIEAVSEGNTEIYISAENETVVSPRVKVSVAGGRTEPSEENNEYKVPGPAKLDSLPEYDGNSSVPVNYNNPFFTEQEITDSSFEFYGELDSLGRCTYAVACIGYDLMPTEARGSIWEVKPTAWRSAKYDFIDGESLYNRCHLIGYQLSGENANEKNLITGTRYMNTEGMNAAENMVADYVKETKNHVMYRVTPFFKGDDLLASGVLMEAWSVEDEGDSICFCIYCFNVQPGIGIDYSDGDNWLIATDDGVEMEYVLNTNSKKFHLPTCPGIADIKEGNKKSYTGTREKLILGGYIPCSTCNP
ncbi:MAG: DNA/RNA non-specific endonuclease [Clostridia bacterium]|nr:DNA/RNA non-specific endonuclease [Clostridia bacterium]